MPDNIARPFPVTLEVEFLDRLSEPVREGRAKSVSDIIRTALAQYDFSNVVVLHPSQLQISVRLPVEIRRNLKKISRAKHTSVGQLVRAAVEAYLPQLETAVPAEKKPATKRKRPKKRISKG
jgi:Arc/MetJ-type ribon-helix-helix transcriptional regulator